jgi:hypothetical protein
MAVYYVGDNGPDGVCLGTATTEKIGFYGKTPIVQPTSSFATSAVGTASSADVTTVDKAAIIAIGNTLSALGIWPAQA